MIDKAGGWAEVAKSTQTALGKLANNWDDTDDIRIFNNRLEGWILQTKKFYYSLDDTKRKLLDEVGDGFINFVKGFVIALSAKTLFSATTGVMNLTRAITTLGTRANQVAGQVATGKGGGKLKGAVGGVGSALAIGYAD
ncbi:phage tail tape measure protein, partial [Escherichia coli]|nr:phage tail tape measure protein [Escherichia coli]